MPIKKLRKDLMLNCDAVKASRQAYALVQSLQSLRPDEQVPAVALLFVSILRRYDLNHAEVLQFANRFLDLEAHKHVELKALGLYVEKMLDDEVINAKT